MKRTWVLSAIVVCGLAVAGVALRSTDGNRQAAHDDRRQDPRPLHQTPPGKNTRCTNQYVPAAMTTTEPA